MKKFVKVLSSMMSILAVFYFVNPCFAQEKATKEECIAKCKEAVKLIKEMGLEAALEKINDPNGPFTWKNTYVFCFEDETAKMLGHPYVYSEALGISLKNKADVNGKKYFEEFLKIAKTKGEGWVSYMYKVKKKVDEPNTKITYIYKV